MSLQTGKFWAPTPKGRPLYGRRDMELLVSNNPSCLFGGSLPFPPRKVFSTVNNPEFEILFPQQIRDKILACFLPHQLMHYLRSMHVLRARFVEDIQNEGIQNPIVIHILVERDTLSHIDACIMVSKVESIISSAQWKGEKIYVDICQTGPRSRLRATNSLNLGVDEDPYCPGKDKTGGYVKVYHHSPPLPGSSLGPKDRISYGGTLLGYIRHGSDIFAVTSKNVVNYGNPPVLGTVSAYEDKDGQEKCFVTSPAGKDHNFNLESLEDIIKDLQALRDNAEDGLARQAADELLPIWEEEMNRALNYNIDLGYIYATSGRDKKSGTFPFDWAIIHCPLDPNIQNKHRGFDTKELEMTGFHILAGVSKNYLEGFVDEDWLAKTTNHFSGGPCFGPISNKPLKAEGVYLKPPSRSSNWKLAICNGIKATMNRHGEMTEELCFVTPGVLDQVRHYGDSGSVIIDKDYQPVAMVRVGYPVVF